MDGFSALSEFISFQPRSRTISANNRLGCFVFLLTKAITCNIYPEIIRAAGFVVALFSASLPFYAKLFAAEDTARADATLGQAPALQPLEPELGRTDAILVRRMKLCSGNQHHQAGESVKGVQGDVMFEGTSPPLSQNTQAEYPKSLFNGGAPSLELSKARTVTTSKPEHTARVPQTPI